MFHHDIPSGGEYEELLSLNSELSACDELKSPNEGFPKPQRVSTYRLPSTLVWALVVASVLVLADVATVAIILRMRNTVYEDKDFRYNPSLEYANPYIGLAELYSSGIVEPPILEPILLRPQLSAQVFVNEPNRLAPRGERDYWLDEWGRLSPNERHLQITPNINTIVQFRTIDFGMEDCHLVLTFPEAGAVLEDGAAFSLSPDLRLDVFRLSAERPVDVKKLSYRTRPQVLGHFETVKPSSYGETLIHRFPCPWSSLHIFQLACAGERECALDVWSSQNTSFGVNIYQHQTI